MTMQLNADTKTNFDLINSNIEIGQKYLSCHQILQILTRDA